jgi:hypothetical protein
MSEPQARSSRSRWIGRIAVATTVGFVAIFLVVWRAATTSGLIVEAGPNGEGCRVFWDATPESVVWSPGGRFLAVVAHVGEGDTGVGELRVFRLPGMALVNQTSDIREASFAIDDLGVLSWRSGVDETPAEAAISSAGIVAEVRTLDPGSPGKLCVERPGSRSSGA